MIRIVLLKFLILRAPREAAELLLKEGPIRGNLAYLSIFNINSSSTASAFKIEYCSRMYCYNIKMGLNMANIWRAPPVLLSAVDNLKFGEIPDPL